MCETWLCSQIQTFHSKTQEDCTRRGPSQYPFLPTASPTNQSGAAVLIVGIWPLMNTWHEDSNTFQHASKLSLPPPNDKEFKLGGGNDLLSGKIRNLIFFLLITSFLMMPSVTGAINNNERETTTAQSGAAVHHSRHLATKEHLTLQPWNRCYYWTELSSENLWWIFDLIIKILMV